MCLPFWRGGRGTAPKENVFALSIAVRGCASWRCDDRVAVTICQAQRGGGRGVAQRRQEHMSGTRGMGGACVIGRRCFVRSLRAGVESGCGKGQVPWYLGICANCDGIILELELELKQHDLVRPEARLKPSLSLSGCRWEHAILLTWGERGSRVPSPAADSQGTL